MAVSNYDLTTNVGKVRLLISDTDVLPVTDAQFTDAEITYFLTLSSGSILLAASYALESWAASITDSLKSEKIGDYSYSKDTAGNKIALAKKYREEDATSPYLTWAEFNLTGETTGEDVE